SERFSVERNPVKNLQIAALEPRRVRLWKVRGKGRMRDAGANVLSENFSVRTVQNGSNDIFFRLQGGQRHCGSRGILERHRCGAVIADDVGLRRQVIT